MSEDEERELSPDLRRNWFVLNDVCQNRCIHCYDAEEIKAPYRDKTDVINTDEFADWMKDTIKADHITLLGGEPTLYPNLMDLIIRYKARNITMGIITNGIRFSDPDFCRNIIDAGIYSVSMTFLGPTAETHDRLTRNEGSFENAIMGQKNLIEMGGGINRNMLSTVMTENIDDVEGLVMLADRYKIRTLSFNLCTPRMGDSRYSPDFRTGVDVALRLEKMSKETDTLLRLTTPLPYCFFHSDNERDRLYRKGIIPLHSICQPFTGYGCVIKWNGDVLSCAHLWDMVISSVRTQQERKCFLEDWICGKAAEFRKKWWRYPSKKCSTCKDWGKCVGGCTLFWLKHNADEYI